MRARQPTLAKGCRRARQRLFARWRSGRCRLVLRLDSPPPGAGLVVHACARSTRCARHACGSCQSSVCGRRMECRSETIVDREERGADGQRLKGLPGLDAWADAAVRPDTSDAEAMLDREAG
eukprot:863960-Pleurochrysis_carterae.AAC.1